MKNILILVTLTAALYGLFELGLHTWVRQFIQTPPYAADQLRSAILAHLEHTFAQTDTLVIYRNDRYHFECPPVNLRETASRPVFFDARLDQKPLSVQVAAQLGLLVLSLDTDPLTDSFQNFTPPSSALDSKLYLGMEAEKLGRKWVRTFERYTYKGRVKKLEKDFRYERNRWRLEREQKY